MKILTPTEIDYNPKLNFVYNRQNWYTLVEKYSGGVPDGRNNKLSR